MIRRSEDGGFVLVEVITALAVAAIAAASLMMALTTVSTRASEAQTRSLALRQAEFLISETISAPAPQNLPTRGALSGARISWTRSLDEPDTHFPGLQHVVVEITWRGPKSEGRTRLEAYRIAS